MERATVDTELRSRGAAGADRRARPSRARCAANPDRVALRTRGGEREITWGEYGEQVDRVRAGPARPGRRARRRGRPDAHQPARVPHRRHRRDEPRRDAVLPLPDADAGPDRLPAERLRRRGDRDRAGVPRARAGGARAGCRSCEHVVLVDGDGAEAGAIAVRRPARDRGRHRGDRALARGGRAGRPADADLHVRHDRTAEGRADHARAT